jgi:hypothetical protein
MRRFKMKIVACKKELRIRDKKQKRLLLIVGKNRYHISRNEAKKLAHNIITRLI